MALTFSLLQLLALSLYPLSTTSITFRTWSDARTLAADVVANMTLDEKVGVITGVGQFSSQCTGNTNAVFSLNIPSLCMNDGPAGMRGVDLVSAFPAGIHAAATWDLDLIYQRGVAIGEEFRGKGAHIFLGPCLDIMRAPEAGRAWESFGADPFLVAQAGAATIQGVQSVGVQAVAKHFILYNEEHYRFTYTSNITSRPFREIYLPPFISAVSSGTDVSAIMCAYNRVSYGEASSVDEEYSCLQPGLIGEDGILKGENGWEGYVMSDWGASHGAATDEAAAGLDMEQPGDYIIVGGGVYGLLLELDVDLGSVNESVVDTFVTNILTPYYRLNQDDSSFPNTSYNVQSTTATPNDHVDVRSANHTALIREIGAKGTVLLKNVNSALPLSKTGDLKVAVIGSDAGTPDTTCDLNACDNGTLSVGWGSGTNLLTYLVTPLDVLSSNTTELGISELIQAIGNDADAGAEAATGADVALVFVNADSGEIGAGFTNIGGNYGDRNNLSLWYGGDELILSVASVNPNTVVIIHTVGPVVMEEWIENPNVTAVLIAGLPGEQSGEAIADVLWGNVNPQGKLPYTVGKNQSDYPADVLSLSLGDILSTDPIVDYTEGLLVDYRWFDSQDITPRYEFGYGISYTNYTYSSLSISSSSSYPITVSFSVENIGKVTGTEVSQVYIGFPTSAGEPPKNLKGFAATTLTASESTTVEIELEESDISIWDVTSQSWVVPTGIFDVYVGASSRNILLTGSFTVA